MITCLAVVKQNVHVMLYDDGVVKRVVKSVKCSKICFPDFFNFFFWGGGARSVGGGKHLCDVM